jgi:hypothetical protein
MGSKELGLLPFLDSLIAGDLGISPEQVTGEFIHEMRKLMYADPLHQILLRIDERDEPATLEEILQQLHLQSIWQKKSCTWAQQVLQSGPTPCG